MAEEDQGKTTFITSQELYCYKVMPFGLKNARATYQRLVNKMFSKQIGKNMEVYVDDMLVKSKEELTHLDDLKEKFATLRQYQIKLNPSKCIFGVASSVRDRAPGPFYDVVGPNPREWVESCYCLSKWRFD